MKAVHCPIDTALNYQQANKLIRDLRPGALAVPDHYTMPPASAPHRLDLIIEQSPVSYINMYYYLILLFYFTYIE